MEKYFFGIRDMRTQGGYQLVAAYLAFLPGPNCVSRTWYYVFHAYRLYRDLGGNTARWKTAVPTTGKQKSWTIRLEDFIKKKK